MSEYAKRMPDPADLVGHWKPNRRTIEALSKGPYRNLRPSFDVWSNGTIIMHEVPDTWRSPGGEGTGHGENLEGTWELSKHQNQWWGLRVVVKGWVCDGCFMVLGDKTPHRLVIRYGDPDSGQGYEFEKAAEPALAADRP